MSVILPRPCPGCGASLCISLPEHLNDDARIVCRHCGAVSVARVDLRPVGGHVHQERRLTCPNCGQRMAIRWEVYPRQETPPDSILCPSCDCSFNTKE